MRAVLPRAVVRTTTTRAARPPPAGSATSVRPASTTRSGTSCPCRSCRARTCRPSPNSACRTRVVNALARRGIEKPFPIQAATIPDILSGRDLLGRAATGAGKTLAFGLPLLARLDTNGTSSRRPRALILVPTRELAMQVRDSIDPIAAACNLSTCLVAGGLPIGKQITALNRGVDVVVATPGRLVDLIERRAVDLGWVQTTVLDEADHMADLGFLPVVRQLLDMTPSTGQRLLFSATLDGDVATLVAQLLDRPGGARRRDRGRVRRHDEPPPLPRAVRGEVRPRRVDRGA